MYNGIDFKFADTGTVPHYRNLHCKKKSTYNIKALYDCNSMLHASNCTLSDVEWQHSCKSDMTTFETMTIFSRFPYKDYMEKFCHHLLTFMSHIIYLFFLPTMEVNGDQNLVMVTNILKNNFILSFSQKKRKSYRFGMTWGWVNDRIFIFGQSLFKPCCF